MPPCLQYWPLQINLWCCHKSKFQNLKSVHVIFLLKMFKGLPPSILKWWTSLSSLQSPPDLCCACLSNFFCYFCLLSLVCSSHEHSLIYPEQETLSYPLAFSQCCSFYLLHSTHSLTYSLLISFSALQGCTFFMIL